MPSFPGVDFLDFDSLLSDEEKLARQTARQFVDDEILPIIEQYNREGKFPVQLVPQMAELGLFGASLKGYGCAGMSNVEYGLVMQELERGDSGLRSFVSVQSALVMYPIYTFGSDAQKDKWLPLLQQGKAIGCFGLTEPQFGSNPGGMLTRAVKQGSSYILNGEKMWITNGSIADVAVVWAKMRGRQDPRLPRRERHAGIQGPGHSRQIFAARFGHFRPRDDRLQDSGGKSAARRRRPERARFPASIRRATASAGAPSARPWPATTRALNYAKQRKQFDNRPIASHQLVQEKLVWMITEITKAQFLASAGGPPERPGPRRTRRTSPCSKMNNVWMALETARTARDILGANGIVDDYPIMRHMANLESVYHLRRHARYPQAHHRRTHHRNRGLRVMTLRGFFTRQGTPSAVPMRRFENAASAAEGLSSEYALFSTRRRYRTVLVAQALLPVLLLIAATTAKTASPQAIANKPKIRAVTAFIRLDRAKYESQIQETLKFLRTAKSALEKSGYEVEGIRITTQPFPEYTKGLSTADALAFFRAYDALAVKEGFDASIGPAMTKDSDDPRNADLLAQIIANSKILEGSVSIAGEDGIHWKSIHATAGIIEPACPRTPHPRWNTCDPCGQPCHISGPTLTPASTPPIPSPPPTHCR